MKKLIIFDLDGTLLDTLVDLKNAVNVALLHYNFPQKDIEHVRKSIGNGVNKLIARCLPDAEDNPLYLDVLNYFKTEYSKHSLDNTKPYDGIKEILINLHKQGYKLAVCTNKVDEIAKTIIDRFFPNIFDYVQGDVPFLKKKPNKEMIEYVLKHFNFSKKDALYIGDTNVDEETAKNADVDYILVDYGYRTIDELKEQCPKACVCDMQHLVIKINEKR